MEPFQAISMRSGSGRPISLRGVASFSQELYPKLEWALTSNELDRLCLLCGFYEIKLRKLLNMELAVLLGFSICKPLARLTIMHRQMLISKSLPQVGHQL